MREVVVAYLHPARDGSVQEVREKNAISNKANVGAYGFESGLELRRFIQRVLDNPTGLSTEYYLSHIINNMLQEKHIFAALHLVCLNLGNSSLR